jgi:hypothetical protein
VYAVLEERDEMKIKVRLNEKGLGKVLLDGQDISNCVRGLELNTTPGNMTNIIVNIAGEIEFDGPVEVFIKDLNGRKIALASYLQTETKEFPKLEIPECSRCHKRTQALVQFGNLKLCQDCIDKTMGTASEEKL